jgi:urease accessory protein
LSGDRLLVRDLAALAAVSDLRPSVGAQVDLVLATDPAGGTFVARQRVAYPFHLGRSLSVPEDPRGMPTLYVQSCSGGIFEHDELGWCIVAGERTQAHVTTSASTIVHGMPTGEATQEVSIEAQAGAFLEYLPDPLILFSGARLRSRLRVRLDPQATVLACDSLVPHDPSGEGGYFDWVTSELRVEAFDGTLLACDRYRLSGDTLSRSLPGVTGPFPCQGGFLALSRRIPAAQLVSSLRAALPDDGSIYTGVTKLPGECGAWMRVLARDASALREGLRRAWYSARRSILGAEPRQRRK